MKEGEPMSGMGAGHNKFVSCKHCPDRCADPNCHETCEGYKYRTERIKKTNKKKKHDTYTEYMIERAVKYIEKKGKS